MTWWASVPPLSTAPAANAMSLSQQQPTPRASRTSSQRREPPAPASTPSQSPACNYHILARSYAACPQPPPAPAPILPPPNAPIVPVAAGGGPMAPYLCGPTLVDSAGTGWSFNLTTLYTPSGYTVSDGGNGTVDFNVCGFAATTCTPTYSVAANVGVVIHGAGGPPPNPSAQCYTINGTLTPCTAPCDTLASSAPIASLTQPSNGGAGVTLVFQDTWPLADQPSQCPSSPVNGVVDPFTVSITIVCDPTTPANRLTGIAFTSLAPCVFAISGQSSAGCGAKVALDSG